MGYNWKRSLRKALTSFLIAICPKLIEIQRVPTLNEAWIAAVIGVMAFTLTIQKEEETEISPPASTDSASKTQTDSSPKTLRKKISEDWLL